MDVDAIIQGTGLQIWKTHDGLWSYGWAHLDVGVGDDGFATPAEALQAFLKRLSGHDLLIVVVTNQ